MHDVGDHDPLLEGGVAFHYLLDNVELTTIGVDVGSSTFHFMFGRVHLRRAGTELSSRFDVVSREVLWRSPVELTPYVGRSIDAGRVAASLAKGHGEAGLPPGSVDTGAVILTGEALRSDNARALAEAIAASTGDFVCVSAGHQLEAMLAAFGSGAVAAASARGIRLLHVDIGGGTTKLSLIDPEGVRRTATVNGGGRIVVLDAQRRIVRTSAGAVPIGRRADVDLAVGSILTEEGAQRVAAVIADVITAIATGGSDPLEPRLRLTPTLGRTWQPEAISFSGGVSEYIYGREDRYFDDVGPAIGVEISTRLVEHRIPLSLVDPGEGIRATVIGAAQSSVQLSGNTVFVSRPEELPLRNIPVVHPHYEPMGAGSIDIARAITSELANHGFGRAEPAAFSMRWSGDPSYGRLLEFVEGVLHANADREKNLPLVVLLDADVAASLGRLFVERIGSVRSVICLDGIELQPFDYVDIGRVIEPAGTLPVVIKSLLFDRGE